MVAHSLGSLGALALFMIPIFAPYAPVAAYMRWEPLLPALPPFVLGLGIAIWIMALPPTLILNYLLRRTRFVTRQDYVVVGFTAGLLLSVPFIQAMGMNVVSMTATPEVSGSWLLLNQVLYVLAWATSGALYGVCYFCFHSERLR